MSFLSGLLLVLVSAAGAFVVARVIEKFVSDSPDANWESMIVLLIGAGLLIWPVARQASLRSAEKDLSQYRQLLEIQDLESYRLVKTDTGETLEIVKDPESGEIRLKAAAAPEQQTPDVTNPETAEEPPAPSSP
jgi:hypothetical protein